MNLFSIKKISTLVACFLFLILLFGCSKKPEPAICGNNSCEKFETEKNCPTDCSSKAIELGERSFKNTMMSKPFFTEEQTVFISKKFDSILLNGADEKIKPIAEKLRSLNPEIEILKYTNGTNDLGRKPPAEEAYAHNPNSNEPNNRIKNRQFDIYLLNLCSNEWTGFFSTDVKKMVETYNYDGIMVDEMANAAIGEAVKSGWEPYYPMKQVNGKWIQYSEEEWKDCGKNFLIEVKKALPEKIVAFNGLYHHETEQLRDYLQFVDGGIKEGFIVEIGWKKFFQEQQWLQLLNAANEDSKTKRFAAACKIARTPTTDERMLCITSFLLINNPNVSYGMADFTIGSDKFDYYPEMDVPIGTPTESMEKMEDYYDSIQKVYLRKYSNGMAIANPSIESKKVKLNRSYKLVKPIGGGIVENGGKYSGKLEYLTVSEITINPQSGAILLND